MISLRRPEPFAIRNFLDDQFEASFSYAEVGATNGVLPDGYAINHTRKQLGHGHSVFDATCDALHDWQQLRLGWVDSWPHNAPLRAGEHVAVLGRAFGLWWLNACRVVYTLGDRSHGSRFGYAHGTLPDHVASGEERFLVEINSREEVWIDILAFSRPNSALARFGYPLMKRAQRKFGTDSASHLKAIVERNHESSLQLDAS